MRAEPATDALIGSVIGGRYRLVRRVGKGGMGVVYEAEHGALGKLVAVKLLLEKYTDDEEVVARFQREARTASAIGDEHIVEVTDAGTTEDGRPYLVMELLIGQSLATIAEATGPMPAARAIPIVRQVLRGLGAAHAKGIVHRDMKPENVFLVQKPERPDFVKIMDFGISKFMALTESKVRLTATGAVIGTPVYMAPEQAMGTGEIDARVDLYAVGVMLYELLAGRPPFEAPTYIALVTQHLNAPPPPLGAVRPDLPPALIAAVHKALEKEPARRFANAASFAAALPTDAELAGLDGIVTLRGGMSAQWRRDPGSTAAESPGARAVRAAATPGSGPVPTTGRREGFGTVTPASGPVRSAPRAATWPPNQSGSAGAWQADATSTGSGPAPWPPGGGPGYGGPGSGPVRARTPSGGNPLMPVSLRPVETTMQTAARRWPLLAALFAGAAVVGAIVVVMVIKPGDGKRAGASAGTGSGTAEVIATSSLEVVSDPAGATVTVDGDVRGVTPLVIAGLTAGVHEVRLEKEGFAPVVMRKAVREGRDETLSAVMARATETVPAPAVDRGRRDKSGRGGTGAIVPGAAAGGAGTVGTAGTAGGGSGGSGGAVPATTPEPGRTDPVRAPAVDAPKPETPERRPARPSDEPGADRKGNPFGP